MTRKSWSPPNPIARARKHNRDCKQREAEAKRARVFITKDGRGRPVHSR